MARQKNFDTEIEKLKNQIEKKKAELEKLKAELKKVQEEKKDAELASLLDLMEEKNLKISDIRSLIQ